MAQHEALYMLSLRGFANCVRIAAEFGSNTERDAFITMLAKYTYLESTKAMGKRNIECFKALVQIALSDGNGLGNSWAQVLKCLSEFQRLHMIGTGAKTDAQLFFPSHSNDSNGGAASSTPPSGSKQSSLRSTTRTSNAIIQTARPRSSTSPLIKDHELAAVDELNSQTMVDKVDVVAIDRIFSSSAQLNPDAIVHFVTHLCAVSREELSNLADPQVYSLQKIVEIAYYNMPRVRLVWARIWEVLGEFFTEVGQHQNLSIAMYAVDSLRQLSAKFLEKVWHSFMRGMALCAHPIGPKEFHRGLVPHFGALPTMLWQFSVQPIDLIGRVSFSTTSFSASSSNRSWISWASRLLVRSRSSSWVVLAIWPSLALRAYAQAGGLSLMFVQSLRTTHLRRSFRRVSSC